VDEEEDKELTFGKVTINFPRKEVLVDNESVGLTPTEFDIVAAMAKQPNRVFSRTQLIHEAFGYGYESFERTIDVHVKHIRDKVEPDPNDPTYIQTEFGMGYKFTPQGD